MVKKSLYIILFSFFYSFEILSQNLSLHNLVFEEFLRREQLINENFSNTSFLLRPISYTENDSTDLVFDKALNRFGKKNLFVEPLPIYSFFQSGLGPPYPEASIFLPSKGVQTIFSTGIYARIGILSIQMQPEFYFSQNLFYDTGISKSDYTQYIEMFGEGKVSKILPGQSSLSFNFGPVSLGASTQNIWWGPGQFNSLIFSRNAFGFEHLSFHSNRPLKSIIGDFEAQVLIGKLNGFLEENQNLIDDWRYLNGLTFSYQPKFLKGFYIGVSRVFQKYSSLMGNSFFDYFPIFEPFQKINLANSQNGQFDSTDYDLIGQDQQLTGFVRYLNKKANAEIYFEYGRRDHAFNWRDAILNPEHARAYLLGFNKIIYSKSDELIQIRGEILQQQESINILVRYGGTGGGTNWAGHIPMLHGFTQRGQMLGPGVGPSSNVQTLEAAWVKGFNKLGLRFERLNRHQDIYTKFFNDPSEQGRWVDLSARLLADWQWDNLIISSNINFVNSLNHQWQLDPKSTPDFPQGKNLFSVHSQVSLIYLPKGLKRFPKNFSN
jgi:hypothetical protein